jgi:hypothetical protein
MVCSGSGVLLGNVCARFGCGAHVRMSLTDLGIAQFVGLGCWLYKYGVVSPGCRGI